jgi:hypothetical protein
MSKDDPTNVIGWTVTEEIQIKTINPIHIKDLQIRLKQPLIIYHYSYLNNSNNFNYIIKNYKYKDIMYTPNLSDQIKIELNKQ